jgi:hypothetical protein
MAGSTLDPDNAGQRRRRRKTVKDDDTRVLGPSDSSDSGSDVVGAPTEREARTDADRGFDRVVGANEAGLGDGLDQAEEARLGVTDDELRGEIAESAYYRAQKRGFVPGQEDKDWLEAEAEVKSRPRKRR